MPDIIKTWPSFIAARSTAALFSDTKPPFCRFYFTLGRGRPKLAIANLWFTYQGRILGSFAVEAIVVNDGSLPRLRSLDGGDSDWQIRKDAWVAVCMPPCHRLRDRRLFMDGFRGWRYFDLAEWATNPGSRHRF